MSMMIGGNTAQKVTRIKDLNGNTVATVSFSSPKKGKKKRLQYSFKSISNQIMMAKTPNIAKMVATKARGKVAMLQRNIDNDDYDETELRHAIIHAKKMLRIAKKKMKHLEEEMEAKQKPNTPIEEDGNGMPDLPDEEEKEQEEKELELDQMIQEYQDIMSEFMTEAMNEMMNQMMEAMELEELADEFMGEAKLEDLEPEDLDRLKKKHRSDELREIMEADMKYLKAMINKLERERQELSTENYSAPSVTLEISGVQMPVQPTEAPVTPEGEVIDVSL
ncbi:MAG: hypothetical protein HFH36_10655 [Lachnospiraceae bacterium]|nr:hypothetical protein [Lachnospiraceae bacterium]